MQRTSSGTILKPIQGLALYHISGLFAKGKGNKAVAMLKKVYMQAEASR